MLASEFKTKVLPLNKKILRFAIYMINDEEEARDVVQDVFLKLWQKRESLEKVENIEAFTMQMTKNRCVDLFRSRRSIPIEDELLKAKKMEHKNLQQEIEMSEGASIIRKLIGRLPEIQRIVMLLRDIEQYEYEEIAKVTNLNINAIRVTLSRARKKVKDEFLKHQQYGTGSNKKHSAKIF